MGFKLGTQHKLYVQTVSPRATWPTSGAATNLSEVTNCRDLTFGGDSADDDVSTRGGGGFRQKVATLADAEIQFEMVYDTADTDFTFLRDAWIAKTVFGAAVLDGDSATAGVQGMWMDCVVTGFEWSQPLEGASKVSVTLANTYSAVAFEAVTVG